jgi:D-glycero-D-manno-heptose 1,7-bisphosphate phosphatase
VTTGGSRAAVFLDRDGTLIRDVNFLSRPEQVELLPGTAAAVRRVNEAGLPAIVVTNQSGIARGYFTEADNEKVHARMEALLEEQGARVDATYVCPHYPEVSGPCECRKPGTLLYRRAVSEHGLDARASWFIGDKLRDVSPAGDLGGTGILVPSDQTSMADVERARKDFIVEASLDAAIARVIESLK